MRVVDWIRLLWVAYVIWVLFFLPFIAYLLWSVLEELRSRR